MCRLPTLLLAFVCLALAFTCSVLIAFGLIDHGRITLLCRAQKRGIVIVWKHRVWSARLNAALELRGGQAGAGVG